MNINKKLLIGLTVIAAAVSTSAFALQPANNTDLRGNWVNVNPATGGIVKMVVKSDAETGFTLHTYGACSPTPCDHGEIAAASFSDSVVGNKAVGLSGAYDFGFSKMQVTAKRIHDLDGGDFLQVESRTQFVEGDTRTDYMRTELFRRK